MKVENSDLLLERDLSVTKCPSIEYKPTILNDARFNAVGTLSLYDLQEANGVYDALDDSDAF